MIPILADGFRQLGHQVTAAIRSRNQFYPNLQYDVDLGPNLISWSWKVNRAAQLTLLPRMVASHDVFVFQWAGESLLHDNRDYPILKLLGKRIISLFCGDDVRHASAYTQEFPSFTHSADQHQKLHTDPLARPLRNIRMAERYSDVILSAPSLSGLALRPYFHAFVPLKISEYRGDIPGREVPLVVHAPSNKSVKGTHLVLPVLERLRSEGVPFELHLLHDIPHKQVLSELAGADVTIDQLHIPAHGMLGVEAMASGCALATCNLEEYEPIPPNRPIWHIDPNNLYSQLKQLLTVRELRISLAHQGLEYVKTYHDHVAVARRVLEHLNLGKPEQYDHYPAFFSRNYRLSEGLKIPQHLKRLTAEVVQRWGLPEDVNPQDLIRRGLMSANGFNSSKPIPRW